MSIAPYSIRYHDKEGAGHFDGLFLKECLNHEMKIDCTTCTSEEKRSKSSKRFNGSNIIDLKILPERKCLSCQMEFEITDNQHEHFFSQHTCHSCDIAFFDDIEMKKKHEINYHKCHLCDEVFHFNSMRRKLSHLKTFHNGTNPKIIQ